MEVKIRLTPYEVHCECEKCAEGVMLPAKGAPLLGAQGPEQILHMCNKCHATKFLPRPYPYLTYEYDLPKDEDQPETDTTDH